MYIKKKKYFFIVFLMMSWPLAVYSFGGCQAEALLFRSGFKAYYKEKIEDEDTEYNELEAGEEYHLDLDGYTESVGSFDMPDDQDSKTQIVQIIIEMYQELIQAAVMYSLVGGSGHHHQTFDKIAQEIILRHIQRMFQVGIQHYIDYVRDEKIGLCNKIAHSLLFFTGIAGAVITIRQILLHNESQSQKHTPYLSSQES
jgi:hypothetical protein